MKRLYTTIFATALATAGLMAQSNSSLAFTFAGETVANGATVTVANSDALYAEVYEAKYYFPAPINVKNVSSEYVTIMLSCRGIENYHDAASGSEVGFCFGGACQPWSNAIDGVLKITNPYYDVAAGLTIIKDDEAGNTFYAHSNDDKPMVVELTAYDYEAPSDAVTITVRFDPNGKHGVNGIQAVASEAVSEVYNLCGKLIARSTHNLTPGVYIVCTGNTSRKVTIR